MNIFILIAIIMPVFVIPIHNNYIKGILVIFQILCMIIGFYKNFKE